MQDLVPRSKLLFWGLFASFLLLTATPSLVLVQAARRYLRLAWKLDPAPLRAVRTRVVFHREPFAGAEPGPRPIRFIEFRLKAPRAKQVLLGGDFNRWRPETLPLKPGGGGAWELRLPLPPGRYRYLFQVDGRWTPDPAAKESEPWESTAASVRRVE